MCTVCGVCGVCGLRHGCVMCGVRGVCGTQCGVCGVWCGVPCGVCGTCVWCGVCVLCGVKCVVWCVCVCVCCTCLTDSLSRHAHVGHTSGRAFWDALGLGLGRGSGCQRCPVARDKQPSCCEPVSRRSGGLAGLQASWSPSPSSADPVGRTFEGDLEVKPASLPPSSPSRITPPTWSPCFCPHLPGPFPAQGPE